MRVSFASPIPLGKSRAPLAPDKYFWKWRSALLNLRLAAFAGIHKCFNFFPRTSLQAAMKDFFRQSITAVQQLPHKNAPLEFAQFVIVMTLYS